MVRFWIKVYEFKFKLKVGLKFKFDKKKKWVYTTEFMFEYFYVQKYIWWNKTCKDMKKVYLDSSLTATTY